MITEASRFTIAVAASSYSFLQSPYSFSDNIFCANTKVRNPYRDKSSHSSNTKPRRVYDTLSFITVSAPFM